MSETSDNIGSILDKWANTFAALAKGPCDPYPDHHETEFWTCLLCGAENFQSASVCRVCGKARG